MPRMLCHRNIPVKRRLGIEIAGYVEKLAATRGPTHRHLDGRAARCRAWAGGRSERGDGSL